MNLLEEFKDLLCIGYRKRQVKNEPTEVYFFLVRQTYHLHKNKKHSLLRNEIIKSGVVNNKHVNIAIQYKITSINERKSELTNKTRM